MPGLTEKECDVTFSLVDTRPSMSILLEADNGVGSMSTRTSRFSTPPGEEVVTACRAFNIEPPEGAPPRAEGDGPYQRLLLKNAMLIDGTGAPAQGPFHILVIRDRIAEIRHALFTAPPEACDHEIECSGKFVLPGLVDSHVHIGNPSQGFSGKITPATYVFKLWMAHGVTTVRECGALNGLAWTLDQERKSDDNLITAPRIVTYPVLYYPWLLTEVTNAEEARAWIKEICEHGIKGIKLFGHNPEVMRTVFEEADSRGLRTACHHTVTWTGRLNALDTCRMGLTSMEHFLGLAEALSDEGAMQNYPADYVFDDEQMRVLQDAHMWRKVTPGSPRWKAVMGEMLERDLSIVPTLSSWEPGLDVMRYLWAEWHEEYTLPALWRFFQPNPMNHWSYYWDWTTANEIEYRQTYPVWMQFVNEYKNLGGRITVGSDSGFGLKLFGFDTIRELELLQAAGFHPLEVIDAATRKGAELLGMDEEIGTVEPGKKADMLIVDESPLLNFKVLYGTGHMRLEKSTMQVERVKALRYTIKDGIIYDAQQLLADVREMVAREKEAEAAL